MTTQVSRRTFIKTASMVGAGLVIGIDLNCGKLSNANAQGQNGAFEPNVWLKIEQSGDVTIMFAKSEMGQGVRTSLPMIVAEELEADWSKVKVEQALTDQKKYGNQSTGGSTSTRTLYTTMRKAGAAAREMLIEAAASQWNVSKAECAAENGTVVHTSSGKKLNYGDLVEAAAKLSVPSDPVLKDPGKFRFLRKKMARVDTPSKVDGSAQFGIDIRIPGMVYAAVARPSTFGSTVQSFDAAKAKTIFGVQKVIQTGDIVAVIANSTWAAFQGRDALSVMWTKSEYEDRTTDSLWKQFETMAKSEGDVEHEAGDAEKAYENAAKKIDAVYYAPFVAHATMEPMNCTVRLQDKTCEIWAPSQTPQDAQRGAADALGIPVEDVILHVTLLGGGFGRRLETDFVVEAVKIAKEAALPVKVVWTREEDMQHDFYRPAQYSYFRGGLDANGTPVAWLHRIAGPESKGLLTHACKPSYDFANLKIDAQATATGVPTGAWRSVGASQNGFMIESFIDELAFAAGKDPFEFRRNLLSGTPRLKHVLEVAADKAGWGTVMPKGKGRGIACVAGFGSFVAYVAEVSVSGDNKVHVDRVVIAVDCGPYVNPDGIEAQLQSATAFGLSAAMKDEITIEKGGVKQTNFDDYRLMMIDDMPKVEVHIIESDDTIGGIGEPGVPPVAPAVCNAIFAATGKRIRKLPIQL